MEYSPITTFSNNLIEAFFPIASSIDVLLKTTPLFISIFELFTKIKVPKILAFVLRINSELYIRNLLHLINVGLNNRLIKD